MGVDPVEYFKEYDFIESLIERIDYQLELKQLEIILRYEGFVRTVARPLNLIG